MVKVNIRKFKARLSKYIALAEAGETVTVFKRNVPVAEVRSVRKKTSRKPVLGSATGMGTIHDSFYNE